MSQKAIIYDAIRSPRGRGKRTGSLYEVTPVRLLSFVLRELEKRNHLDTSLVDDVIMGCVTPIGEEGGDIARTAALYANWHVDVPGMQLNRFCASGLEAVNTAAAKVAAGFDDLIVAGGVEVMSRVPMASDGGAWFLDPDVSIQTGFVPQGISADLLATLEGFSRQEIDELAVISQARAAEATKRGFFKSEIPVYDQNGLLILDHDENIRPGTTMTDLGSLQPSFEKIGKIGFDEVALRKYPMVSKINHLHTAGNSSGIVDGAAAVLVGSEEIGARLGLKPRARIRAIGLVATEPTIMLVGPGPASLKALKKAGMTVKDLDLIEINEAFAGVVLRFLRDLKINDLDRVNVNGGAIAMGHPLGATGAILLGTALDELERRDKQTALISLCVGGGMGIATIIERI